MQEYNSKIVTSDQQGPHEDLIKIISKYSTENYQRPPATFSLKLMDEILPIFEKYKRIILDTGCGTGQSSYHLAQNNPDCFVLGLDKSISRVDRNNQFKMDKSISNYKIYRAELLDMWPLIFQHSKNANWNIVKQCLYYPNPWPKKKAIKRRWQASPVIPFICSIKSEIEIRSNWKIYLEEMKISLEYFTKKEFFIESINPKNPISLFEKKYQISGQELYSINGNLI